MQKITDRILSILLGKLVPVAGYARHSADIYSSVSGRRSEKIISEKAIRREKIKKCKDFTGAFRGTGFFDITFPGLGEDVNGLQFAANVIMDQAIVGTYSHTRISYSQVQISKGSLTGTTNAAAADNEDHNILFSWADESGTGSAKPTDTVVLVAYFPALKKVIYSMAAARKDARALLETNAMEGYNAETWLGFVSTDGKNAADSRYTGTIYL